MADYINREAFIKWVEETYCKPCEADGRDYNHCRCGACQYDDMMRDAESFPTADVRENKRGKWKRVVDFTGVEAFGYKETILVGYGCNVCGYEVDVSEGDFNFCPNCGASMLSGEEQT